MTALRVLHAHSGNLFGGIETMLLTLARRRPDLATHRFALAFEGELARRLRGEGMPVHVLGQVRLRRPWTVHAVRRILRDVIAHESPDVMIVHSAWDLAAFGRVALTARIPLVLWAHARAGGAALDKLAARVRPELVIANSAFTAASYVDRFAGIPQVVVHPPVEPPRARSAAARRALRESLDVSPDAAVIAQVGRIERGKGQLELVEALARLDESLHWVCWEIGGAQRPDDVRLARRIAARVEELGIASRVRFLGPRHDVHALLAAADLYAQPTMEPESFGITFVEAMYAGLPVVATAIGAAAEVVAPAAGVLVPPGDPGALAGVLGELIGDPEKRRQLGAAGPARARELSEPDRQISRAVEALRTVAH